MLKNKGLSCDIAIVYFQTVISVVVNHLEKEGRHEQSAYPYLLL